MEKINENILKEQINSLTKRWSMIRDNYSKHTGYAGKDNYDIITWIIEDLEDLLYPTEEKDGQI